MSMPSTPPAGLGFRREAGALPFSRSLREGGAFMGLPPPQDLVFVRHSGTLH
jgi:hypothetical protein